MKEVYEKNELCWYQHRGGDFVAAKVSVLVCSVGWLIAVLQLGNVCNFDPCGLDPFVGECVGTIE